jgi:hypothetical protein
MISCDTGSSRRALLLFPAVVALVGLRISSLSLIPVHLLPDVNAGERMEESKYVENPGARREIGATWNSAAWSSQFDFDYRASANFAGSLPDYRGGAVLALFNIAQLSKKAAYGSFGALASPAGKNNRKSQSSNDAHRATISLWNNVGLESCR